MAYGQLEQKANPAFNPAWTTDVLARRQFSVGYHYSLSKRTTLYVDATAVSRDKAAADAARARELAGGPKDSGWLKDRAYDVGLKHNF